MTRLENAHTMIAEAIAYLDALKRRSISFRLLQNELRVRDLPTAKGWLPLLEKYKAKVSSPTIYEEWTAGLQGIYWNHILYGPKAVRVFKVEKDVCEKVKKLLPGLVSKKSEFAKNYPLPISETELQKATFNPTPTGSDDAGRLVLCAKRVFKAREPIELNDFDDEIKDAFGNYDELIGVRCGVTQAFDRIDVLPEKGEIHVYIDLSPMISGEEITRAFPFHIDQFNRWMAGPIGHPVLVDGGVNFYPAIAKLYNDADGRIIRLGHATGTKSIKEERMRSKLLDLREELFHKEGIKAIKDTDAYSISKVWDTASGFPKAVIPGHFSMAGAEKALVRYAIIDGCAGITDFDMILSKLNN